MTNFNERWDAKTKVEVLPESLPYVTISREALSKMALYVHECSDEIGWLGTVEETNNNYHVKDVYLFDQEVHATTTEITPEGLSNFATEILTQPDGMDIWNNMRIWGHSHVNMGITPSGQDDKQMKTFKEGGHPWFLRLIANKKGDMAIDLYHYEQGIIYNNVPWSVEELAEEKELLEQISVLQKQLEDLTKSVIESHKDSVKTEMKDKVRKKTYNYGNKYKSSPTSLYAGKKFYKSMIVSGKSEFIYYDTASGMHMFKNTKDEWIPVTLTNDPGYQGEKKKETQTEMKLDTGKEESSTNFEFQDEHIFKGSKAEVYKEFSLKELELIGEIGTDEEIWDELAGLGYTHISEQDFNLIKEVAEDTFNNLWQSGGYGYQQGWYDY